MPEAEGAREDSSPKREAGIGTIVSKRGNPGCTAIHNKPKLRPSRLPPTTNPLDHLGSAVAHLRRAMSSELVNEWKSTAAFLERAADSFAVPPVESLKPTQAVWPVDQGLNRGGLAPWQLKSVEKYIDACLSASIRNAELAALVQRSISYFSRAFRSAYGCSPHVYVMRRRIELAQCLMLNPHASLGQVALECGFADQAHLNKTFRRFVGQTPGIWRRAHRSRRA